VPRITEGGKFDTVEKRVRTGHLKKTFTGEQNKDSAKKEVTPGGKKRFWTDLGEGLASKAARTVSFGRGRENLEDGTGQEKRAEDPKT